MEEKASIKNAQQQRLIANNGYSGKSVILETRKENN